MNTRKGFIAKFSGHKKDSKNEWIRDNAFRIRNII